MRANGMIHFDAHPKNILFSGDQFYFTDYGLTTSSEFSLSSNEIEVFNTHQNYDIGFSSLILVYELLHFFIGENRNQISSLIQKACEGSRIETLPNEANSILERYSPVAKIMDEFFGKILKNKMTPFPSLDLNTACQRVGL
jgi:hypothetical protein